MATVPVEVKLEGLTGTNGHTGNANPDPLYIPVEHEGDLRGGYIETTAGKVGTDPNFDIFNGVAAWPILLDLTGGAWNEFFDINSRKYNEPYHRNATVSNTTIVTPLLWTLDPYHPLMLGAEHVTTEGASKTFDQMIRFKGKLIALDKTNNKIWRLSGNDGSWVDITPSYGTVGELSFLATDSRNSILICGTDEGGVDRAHKTTASTPVAADWSAFTPTGSLYVTYGNDFFYVSRTSNNYFTLKRRSAVQKKQIPQYVGQQNHNINNVIWADGYLCCGKPDGFFVVEPKRKQGAQLPVMPFPVVNDDNCKVMFLHGRDVFFSTADGGFFSWNVDSGNVIPRFIARFRGHKRKAFVTGNVVAGMSDGQRIFLIYRVLTADESENPITNYYILIGNGVDWHPVLCVSKWGSDTQAAAIHFDASRLRYSCGGKSGYLRTDGALPMVTGSGSYTYSTDADTIGITTGWIDAGRDWINKWWWKLLASMEDRGTKGMLKASYMLWGQTSWTSLGTLTGSQDNAALEFPEADETPDLNISDIVSSKIQLLLELRKADSSEDNTAHYLTSLHLVGLPFYEPAFRCVIVAYLDADEMEHINGRTYNASEVYHALLHAQAQPEPLKLTMPDSKTYYGTILPGSGGLEILDSDKETGAPRRYKYSVVFQEHK